MPRRTILLEVYAKRLIAQCIRRRSKYPGKVVPNKSRTYEQQEPLELLNQNSRSGLAAAGQCRSSCCRCCPLDLHTLLPGLAATCSALDALLFFPRALPPPDSRSQKCYEYVHTEQPSLNNSGLHHACQQHINQHNGEYKSKSQHKQGQAKTLYQNIYTRRNYSLCINNNSKQENRINKTR